MTKSLLFVAMFIVHAMVAMNSLKASHCTPPVLFIFGDSYLDVGNNNYINTSTQDQANFRPYGETSFDAPTGRFSDGRITVDFLAHLAGWKIFIPAYLNPSREIGPNYNGVNFASAGAGVLPTTLPGYSISRTQQVQYYKDEIQSLSTKLGSDKAEHMVLTAAHLITFGANDLIVAFELNETIPSKEEYVEMMIGNFSTMVKAIYDKGGRKFVVQNVLDVGCSPGLKVLNTDNSSGRCLREASQIVALYNDALERLAGGLRLSLPGSEIVTLDLAKGVAQRQGSKNPLDYGLKDVENACCGYGPYNGEFSCGGQRLRVKNYSLCSTPGQYLYWDSFHLTDHAYMNITQDLWNKNAELKGLFECLRFR